MPTVTIIDYGRSNLLSVQRALEFCGAQVAFASDPQQVLEAEALVLPGVGSFADGMAMLRQRGLEKAILAKAEQGTPLLGICLGMQMLLDSSPEGGFTKGLGLIAGPVLPLEPTDVQGQPLRVPHVGWGGLFCAGERPDFFGSPLEKIRPGEETYFVHSYQACPARKQDYLAYTQYGGRPVCAAVHRENVTGVQFHPEKSGEVGLAILRSFLSHCSGA